MSMVEKVARALCAESGGDPDWQSYGQPSWVLYEPSARAAIEAMREATDVMVAGAGLTADEYYFSNQSEVNDFVRAVFAAMIDAALKEASHG